MRARIAQDAPPSRSEGGKLPTEGCRKFYGSLKSWSHGRPGGFFSGRTLGRVRRRVRLLAGRGKPREMRALGREAHPVLALLCVADERALSLLQILEGADDVGVGVAGRGVEYLAREGARLTAAAEEAEHVLLDCGEQLLFHKT